MNLEFNLEQINQICNKFLIKHNFGVLKSLRKIDEGFLNFLYEINGEFILKICGNSKLESNFINGIKITHYYQKKLPDALIIEQDLTKKVIPNVFYFYHKIQGDTLSSIWHLISNDEREKFVRQIADYLKIINSSDLSHILSKPEQSWAQLKKNQLLNIITRIEEQNYLDDFIIVKIKSYLEINWQIFNQSLIAPVYWDVHLGNFLVSNSQIVGILDLESIEYLSIDYSLDLIYRMVRYPNQFLPEKIEKFSKLTDYQNIIPWFKKYYPELFNFASLEKRLILYALEYDLKLLLSYPTDRLLIKRIKEMPI